MALVWQCPDTITLQIAEKIRHNQNLTSRSKRRIYGCFHDESVMTVFVLSIICYLNNNDSIYFLLFLFSNLYYGLFLRILSCNWTWLIFYSNKLFNYLYFFNSLYVSIWWCGSNSFFFFVVFLILIYMFLICPQTLSIPWDVGYYNNHLHNSPLSAYSFDSFIPNV